MTNSNVTWLIQILFLPYPQMESPQLLPWVHFSWPVKGETQMFEYARVCKCVYHVMTQYSNATIRDLTLGPDFFPGLSGGKQKYLSTCVCVSVSRASWCDTRVYACVWVYMTRYTNTWYACITSWQIVRMQRFATWFLVQFSFSKSVGGWVRVLYRAVAMVCMCVCACVCVCVCVYVLYRAVAMV